MKSGTDSRLKFKQLKRKLQLPYWQIVGVLESIWRTTQINAPSGDLGRLSDDEIAAAIEWDASATTLIDALVETRWLDRDEQFRLIVHDWSDHAPNHLKGAFKMHGKLFADQIAKQRARAVCQSTVPEHDATKPNQTKPNLTKPPPREATAGDLDFWDVDSAASARLKLRACKFNRVDELLEDCQMAGLTPRDIVNACDEYMANSDRLTPGAIAERLRKGNWPIDNMIPVSAANEKKAAKKNSSKSKLIDSLRFKLKKIDADSPNWDDERIIKEAQARNLA